MASSKFTVDTLKPLTGPLDCRSSPDEVAPNSFRWLLNMSVTDDGKRARRAGWEKLFYGQSAFSNQDLHDQRDCWAEIAEPDFVREPITMLYEAQSTEQARRLYAATRSRVYLQSGTGWRTIARGYGSVTARSRFKVSQLANTLVFTNGVDRVKMHAFATSSDPCGGGTTLVDIPELVQTTTTPAGGEIRLSQATHTISYNGCVFLLDTVEKGVRYPSRVRWSGFNIPTRWLSGLDTVAGYQDLPYDESIVAVNQVNSNLIIFTDKSIYKSTFDGVRFSFDRLYTEPRTRAKLPAFPNSVVSDGNSLWWWAEDGIYEYNLFISEPTRPEWLHDGTKALFDSVDITCCEQPVGEYRPDTKEIWWSWPEQGHDCLNSRTFIANLKHKTSDYLDHGFTAFLNFRPDTRQTLGEWLAQYCTTDMNQLCETLGSRVIDDFCDECSQEKVFLGASSTDLCLKDIGNVYLRERCTNPTSVGTFDGGGNYIPSAGTYADDGYFSIVRGIFPFGNDEVEKVIKGFLLDKKVTPSAGDTPWLRLRVGTAYGALDPNPQGNLDAFGYMSDTEVPIGHRVAGDVCEVIWRKTSNQVLLCPETRTNTSSLAANTRPNLGTEWPLYEEGRFLYYEITIIGLDGSLIVAPIGGASTYSRIEVRGRLKPLTD